MRIALIWKNDYPWDIRVEKMGRSLLSCGHEIHIIASNNKKEKTHEKLDGLFIHRLKTFKRSTINKIVSTPFFLNPFWVLPIYRVCKKYKVDIIIVRDLPLVLCGIVVFL